MEKKVAFHGSDLEKIEEYYGISKHEIIRFAANVNPLGISPLLKKTLQNNIDVISSYPDRDYKELRKSIGAYLNVSMDHILVGNGSTELISLMAQYVHPKKALILAPTYSEYAREIGLTGGHIDYFTLKEENEFQLQLPDLCQMLEQDYDMLIICNPNNPTSTAISTSQMREIFATCKKHHTFVMVDETYVEFSPDYENITSVSLALEFDNFIVLRGVSKFYAAPGLRLGYAVTSNSSLIELVNQKKNPWTINSLAEQAGIVMFSDEEFNQKTKQLMHQEQNRMYQIFQSSDKYHTYKPQANFLLLKILDSSESADSLFEKAIKNKMMIRNCASFYSLSDRYIRFCFMLPEQNDALAHVLL